MTPISPVEMPWVPEDLCLQEVGFATITVLKIWSRSAMFDSHFPYHWETFGFLVERYKNLAQTA